MPHSIFLTLIYFLLTAGASGVVFCRVYKIVTEEKLNSLKVHPYSQNNFNIHLRLTQNNRIAALSRTNPIFSPDVKYT